MHLALMNPMFRTAAEQGLVNVGLDRLADLMQEVRLRHYSPINDNVFNIACQLNLPWLFFSAEIIRRMHPDQWIGFLGRDCQLLELIYRHYFSFACSYVPFSRMAAANLDAAVDYLNSFSCDVLVDISSTGATWQKLGQRQFFPVRVLIYSDVYSYTANQPVAPPTFKWVAKNSEIGATNELIEFFNQADHGMLTSLPDTYAEHESSASTIQAIQQPVSDACDLSRKYSGITAQLAVLTDVQIAQYLERYLLTICDQKKDLLTVPAFVHYINRNNQTTHTIKNILGGIKNISDSNDVFTYSST